MHPPISRRRFHAACAAALGTTQLPAAAIPPTRAPRRTLRVDHLCGTSLDVAYAPGGAEDCEALEESLLAEVERLRRIFSLYDPASELARLNQSGGWLRVSPELWEVLQTYDALHPHTDGALSVAPGSLEPAYALDSSGARVRRTGGARLDLNALAKGFILRRLGELLRPHSPEFLVNFGGDLWVQSPALVAVQDPFSPAENARPWTLLHVGDRCVATSGSYLRFGPAGSHLMDPRTGRPARQAVSATVVAPHGLLANALATALCVLEPAQALAVAARFPGVECLLIAPSGRAVRSPGFAAYECEPSRVEGGRCALEREDLFPETHQVAISLELPKPSGKARRPYVAIWIESAEGKPVRSVTVWGNDAKWLRDLSTWWKLAKDQKDLVKAVTRATRAPGKYEVLWDGKDDAGKPVPLGTYTIQIEVHREHGKHVYQTGKLVVGPDSERLTLAANAETGETQVEYREKK